MNLIKSIAAASLILITVSCSSQKETATEKTKPTQERQGPPPNIDEIFKMDINGDGKLTKLEVTGPILKDFDKIDINKDGYITRAEFGEMPKPQGPPGGGGQGGRPNGPPPNR